MIEHTVGTKLRKRGPNNSDEQQCLSLVLINKDDFEGVAMLFICKQPPSHSDEETEIVLRELFNRNNFRNFGT
jgi:hypothetical protein